MRTMTKNFDSLVLHTLLFKPLKKDYSILNQFGIILVRSANKIFILSEQLLWNLEDK